MSAGAVELGITGDLTLTSALEMVRRIEREHYGSARSILVDMRRCGRRLTKARARR